MARGRDIAGLSSVLLVAIVLLAGLAHPTQPVVRAEQPRLLESPHDTGAVDGLAGHAAVPSGQAWSAGVARETSALRPILGSAGDWPPGDGSLVDILGVDGVGVPLGAVLLGYSRHATAEPLSNAVRRQVHEQVRATPGAHIAAIVGEVDVSRSTVRYHLNVLEEAGLIVGETICGKHRYAPAGQDLSTAAALYDEPAREVLAGVARAEPISVTALAVAVDRAPSTVSHHLDRLVDAELLERARTDGRVEVRLLPAARQHIDGTREPGLTDGSAGVTVD